MSQAPSNEAVRIPRWLIWVGTAAIVIHLGAVGANTLAAPSGPWPGGEGGSEMVQPPLMAAGISNFFQDYLRPLRLHHNYHLLANRIPGTPAVYLELKLKDEAGKEIETVRLPDDNANPWVRHRQSLLTQQISWEDRRLNPSPGEVIAAPGQEVPKTQYWDMVDGRLKLITVDVNQVPRNRPVSGPTDLSFMLCRAYTRYLCRTHDAAKVQVLRHHQDPIRPFALTEENVPARAFEEIVSDFGEFSK